MIPEKRDTPQQGGFRIDPVTGTRCNYHKIRTFSERLQPRRSWVAISVRSGRRLRDVLANVFKSCPPSFAGS